jgi:hypothetical protein
MNMKFDLNAMIFSLIILRPKEAFFRWLDPILLRNDLSIDQVYFPEECGVWLVPAIGTFDDEPAFRSYLDSIKPVIVREELGKFGPEMADVPAQITLAVCNDLFDFEIRDHAKRMNGTPKP